MTSTNVHNLPPKSSIIAGVSWDEIVSSNNQNVKIKDEADLDLSCIALNTQNKIVDRIFWGKLQGANDAIVHSGDNESGEGAGDDEQITVNLAKVPSNISSIFFFLSKYSDGVILPQHNLAARVIEEEKEFSRDEPPLIGMKHLHSVFTSSVVNSSSTSGGSKRSFCFCGVLRQNNNSWNVVELSMPIEVESALDPVIEKHCPFLVEQSQSGGMRYSVSNIISAVSSTSSIASQPAAASSGFPDNKQLHRQQQEQQQQPNNNNNQNDNNNKSSMKNRKSAAPLPSSTETTQQQQPTAVAPTTTTTQQQQQQQQPPPPPPTDQFMLFYIFVIVVLFLIPIYLAL